MIKKIYQCDLCEDTVDNFDDGKRIRFGAIDMNAFILVSIFDNTGSDKIICTSCLKSLKAQLK